MSTHHARIARATIAALILARLDSPTARLRAAKIHDLLLPEGAPLRRSE